MEVDMGGRRKEGERKGREGERERNKQTNRYSPLCGLGNMLTFLNI